MDVVKPVLIEFEKDPELKKRVWGSPNPAREAYRLGKDRMKVATNNDGDKKKAEALSLDPDPIKGDAYRKFLKDNEQATKKLMNW